MTTKEFSALLSPWCSTRHREGGGFRAGSLHPRGIRARDARIGARGRAAWLGRPLGPVEGCGDGADGARPGPPAPLLSWRWCTVPRLASRCGAGNGSCACSSTSTTPALRRRWSTSASPMLPSAAARPTTSSRRATRGPVSVTAVGHTGLDRFAAAFPGVTAVRADGRELPFADGAFDLGFSNAVVEHVARRARGTAAVRRRALPGRPRGSS